MRMRPVALEVGREMTRRSQWALVEESMYLILHRCRVNHMIRSRIDLRAGKRTAGFSSLSVK
jgi:hypothetical protein